MGTAAERGGLGATGNSTARTVALSAAVRLDLNLEEGVNFHPIPASWISA